MVAFLQGQKGLQHNVGFSAIAIGGFPAELYLGYFNITVITYILFQC